MYQLIREIDPEAHQIIREEFERERATLILIASENFASPAVMAAAATPLTNKYAEGYPHKRYYGGCSVVDKAEELAIERLKQLFGAEHANVQPHSGSHANMAAYHAFLEPGARILGMDLAHGGHLTHGSPVNYSGQQFEFHSYGVSRETEMLDYDEILGRAKEVRPKMIVTGASAYPRFIDFERFRAIADEVEAVLLADIAHISGMVAVGLHPDAVPCCQVVTSTTHKTLRGPRSGFILTKTEHAKAVDRSVFPYLQGGPLMHIILAKAVAFQEALQPDFRGYQQRILDNAKAMAKALGDRGIRIVSGGTDNHLFLIDLRESSFHGKAIQEALEKAGIITSRSMVPFDNRKPYYTSGIRIGTPAITTQGMGTAEMIQIADWIAQVIEQPEETSLLSKIRSQVNDLCAAFPLYPELDGK
jgi:glycine hydroxymethyltransferase